MDHHSLTVIPWRMNFDFQEYFNAEGESIMTKLDRFIKFVENGGIITDVTLYNCLYAEIEQDLLKAEKWDLYLKTGSAYEYSLEQENKTLKAQLETVEKEDSQ